MCYFSSMATTRMENGVNQKRNCYGFSFLLLSFQVICVVEFFDDMKMKFCKYFHLDRIKMTFLFIRLTIIAFIERSRKKKKKNASDIFDWLTYLYLAFVIIKPNFFSLISLLWSTAFTPLHPVVIHLMQHIQAI